MEGSAVGSSPAAHQGDRAYTWGEASCWHGFLLAQLLADDWRNRDIKRNGGIKTRREQGRCHRARRDPWRPMASRDPFTDPFDASQDPLGLSPEDDLRPPARRPSLSLPTRERTRTRRLCARPPARQRTCSRRLGEPRARASLPSQGRTRGVLRRGESAISPSVDRPSR